MSSAASPQGHAGTAHVPVLLEEVVAALAPEKAHVVLDGTLGGGGHAHALCTRMQPESVFIGVDRDATALARARPLLVSVPPRVILEEENFSEARRVATKHGFAHVDAVVLDLGFSTDQLEHSGRGFSFLKDEPLTMTLASTSAPEHVTAYEVVNEWSEESLADIIFGFGEERRARSIARAIAQRRSTAPLSTTGELAELILGVVPRRGKLHPATKTFQALRMAVNDELGSLERFLHDAPELLAPGGRLAIISFHSLEDRMVKQQFRTWQEEGVGTLPHRKPIIPSREEVARNGRARSAKLRTFIKN